MSYMITDIKKIKRVGVGTLKQNKQDSIKEALKRIGVGNIEIRGYQVNSWVSSMPSSREETMQWAMNRARACFEKDDSIELACWLEWWIYFAPDNTKVYMTWAVSIIDKTWYENTIMWWDILLPHSFTKELKKWTELAHIMDKLRDEQNTNHREWAVWFFTQNAISRTQAFENIVICCLVPRLHSNLYQ